MSSVNQQQSEAAYRDLVLRTADGAKLKDADVMAVCWRAGRTAEHFQRDLALARQRQEWAAYAAEHTQEAFASGLAKVKTERETALAPFNAEIEDLMTQVRTLQGQRAGIIRDYDAREVELRCIWSESVNCRNNLRRTRDPAIDVVLASLPAAVLENVIPPSQADLDAAQSDVTEAQGVLRKANAEYDSAKASAAAMSETELAASPADAVENARRAVAAAERRVSNRQHRLAIVRELIAAGDRHAINARQIADRRVIEDRALDWTAMRFAEV